MRVVKLWNHEHRKDLQFHFSSWEAVPRNSAVGKLVGVASKQAVDKAYRGYSRELTDALGPEPEGCLIKLPKPSRHCCKQKSCQIYIPDNCRTVPKPKALLPWCYEPEGVDSDVLALTSQIVQLWTQGVYVVVIEDS